MIGIIVQTTFVKTLRRDRLEVARRICCLPNDRLPFFFKFLANLEFEFFTSCNTYWTGKGEGSLKNERITVFF